MTLQDEMRDAADELVGSGRERGLQVAVYQRGELVVDLAAGVADPATGRAVAPDTPFWVASAGKGAAGAVVHTLVEQGHLSYDMRIADLWPEFAAHGKHEATLRHALTHSAGVPALPASTTPELLCDWDRICAVIADARPWWEPGTKTGYHPQTYGYIVGEIVRRATGLSVSQALRLNVAAPLGLSRELFFGVPADELDRVARLEEPAGSPEMTPEMIATFAEHRRHRSCTHRPAARPGRRRPVRACAQARVRRHRGAAAGRVAPCTRSDHGRCGPWSARPGCCPPGSVCRAAAGRPQRTHRNPDLRVGRGRFR